MSQGVLIAYSTSEGQTAHVAAFIAERLAEAGLSPTIADLRHARPNPADFEATVVGGSVHAGKLQGEVADFVKTNVEHLNSRPCWFFATSLSEAIEHAPFGHEAAQKQIDDFLGETGWRPRGSASIAGAIKYRDYSWPKRLLMKNIVAKSGGQTDTNRNWEYTNWDGVRAFAEAIAAALTRVATA